jgi:hypothetical protein
VIGISTDDYIDKALAYLRQSNATINHYLDRQLEMENMLGATHLPLTVLVDAKGACATRLPAPSPGTARGAAPDRAQAGHRGQGRRARPDPRSGSAAKR